MDVMGKYVMQKVNQKEKSICQNCIHHNICIAENNQPCFECNRFMDAHGVTVQEFYGCKYCKAYEDLPEHFIDGKPVGRVFDTCIQTDENKRWRLEVPSGADIGIKFCPMCGRKLPKPTKGE